MLLKRLVVATTLAFVIAPVSAKSEDKEMDVQKLFSVYCKESPFTATGAFCLGYIAGVAHHMFLQGYGLKDMKNLDDANYTAVLSACPKEFVSNGALRQIFVNWASKHPERWSKPAEVGVVEAVSEVWRCYP